MNPSPPPRWSRRRFIQSLSAPLVLPALDRGRWLSAAPTTQPATAPSPAPDRIRGRARFEGDRPERHPLDLRMDPFCAKMYRKKPLLNQDLIVDKEGELANVFVWISRGLPDRKWPVPQTPVVLKERCLFIPHVLGVQAGQPLRILNDSSVQEAPHLHGRKNPPLNFTLPRQGMHRDVVLKEPEIVYITCDVHPWEQAWCHVVDHPFFAVSDPSGRFAIDGLEPGTYELTFWHEKLGIEKKSCRLTGNTSPDDIEVAFRMPDRRNRGRRRRSSRR